MNGGAANPPFNFPPKLERATVEKKNAVKERAGQAEPPYIMNLNFIPGRRYVLVFFYSPFYKRPKEKGVRRSKRIRNPKGAASLPGTKTFCSWLTSLAYVKESCLKYGKYGTS